MKRPFIFSNLATSVDGKIATATRELFMLGSRADWKHMSVLRARADAVLMSGEILRVFRRPCGVTGAKQHPVNIVLSRRLEGIRATWPFFTDSDFHRILLVTERPSEATIRRFAKTCVVIWLKPRRGVPVIESLVECLGKLGIRKLLVEGGGEMMSLFAERDLIDEYHVTLTPRVLGGRASPTLVDGAGMPKTRALNLALQSVRRAGSELFLVYRTLRRRGKTHPHFRR